MSKTSVIVDAVRSPMGVKKGKLVGIRADDLDYPQEATVVVYCEHGPRASLARFALQRRGFQRVLYLQGHMSGWKKAGLPTE